MSHFDLDYLNDLGQPVQHCYGVNPYNDHDNLSVAKAYARDSRMRISDLAAHAAAQITGFEYLSELARTRSQNVYDATPEGRIGAVPKRPL